MADLESRIIVVSRWELWVMVTAMAMTSPAVGDVESKGADARGACDESV